MFSLSRDYFSNLASEAPRQADKHKMRSKLISQCGLTPHLVRMETSRTLATADRPSRQRCRGGISHATATRVRPGRHPVRHDTVLHHQHGQDSLSTGVHDRRAARLRHVDPVRHPQVRRVLAPAAPSARRGHYTRRVHEPRPPRSVARRPRDHLRQDPHGQHPGRRGSMTRSANAASGHRPKTLGSRTFVMFSYNPMSACRVRL